MAVLLLFYAAILLLVWKDKPLALVAENLHEFTAYRLLRYEVSGQRYGSWKSSLKGPVNAFPLPLKNHTSNRRGIGLVKVTDLTLDMLNHTQSILGLVVLLPKNLTEALNAHITENKDASVEIGVPTAEGPFVSSSDNSPPLLAEAQNKWLKLKEMEQYLLSHAFERPIYFTWESPELLQLYATLSNNSHTRWVDSRVHFVASAAEPAKIAFIEGTNFVGSIPSGADISRSQRSSTIAIVAHYDAFSSVPGLAVGAENSGSGLIAFAEILRIFSELHARGYRSKFEVLFILSDAGASGFYGIEQWLAKADPLLLDSIEFALCLDAVGGEKLSLHLSKIPRDEAAQKLLDTLQATFQFHGETLDLQVKKVKKNDPHVPWQHEQFTKHKVLSGTISHIATAASVRQRGSVFDYTLLPSTTKNILRQIFVLSEAIAHLIYGVEQPDIEGSYLSRFAIQIVPLKNKAYDIFMRRFQRFIPNPKIVSESSINKAFVEAWTKAVLGSSRFHPLMTKNDFFVQQLNSLFTSYLPVSTQIQFKMLPETVQFYKDEPVKVLVTRSKSPLFDAMHLLLNLFYLGIVYLVVTGGKQLKQLYFRAYSSIQKKLKMH